MKSLIFPFLALLLGLAACEHDTAQADAYGNFEADALTVSAEAKGQLLHFDVAEGQSLTTGALVGLVDTTLLALQRLQLLATAGTLPQKLQDAQPDIAVMESQVQNLLRERERVKGLLAQNAATLKQLDDLEGELAVLQQRMAAAKAKTQLANRAILAENGPLAAQAELLAEQIRRAYVRNPYAGTVLVKMAERGELVSPGSPLYRIAPLDTLNLRFYVSGVQMQALRLGQEVDVRVDAGAKGWRSVLGRITWMAAEAEFTPKTIQTKAERVNLVYAVKAAVPNPDGLLKIGMPAEVYFSATETNEQ